jgi:hypothetical protein
MSGGQSISDAGHNSSVSRQSHPAADPLQRPAVHVLGDQILAALGLAGTRTVQDVRRLRTRRFSARGWKRRALMGFGEIIGRNFDRDRRLVWYRARDRPSPSPPTERRPDHVHPTCIPGRVGWSRSCRCIRLSSSAVAKGTATLLNRLRRLPHDRASYSGRHDRGQPISVNRYVPLEPLISPKNCLRNSRVRHRDRKFRTTWCR